MSLASRKLIQATAGAAGEAADTGDDDFANVVLLLDGDGTSGDNNETFTDSSTNGFTVTENGDVVQGSFSPYGDNWSNYFDGDRDYLSLPSSTDFAFGTGDFTIEHWVFGGTQPDDYPRTIAIGPAYSTGSVGTIFEDDDNPGKIAFYARSLLNGRIVVSTSDVNDNAWHHVAITRSSGVFRLFVDGVLEDTRSNELGSVGTTAQPCVIGSVSSEVSGEDFQGYISDLRIIKGTALYTSDFTPPTGPLSAVTGTSFLGCQSNRFIDNSSNGHTITVNGTPKVTPFSPFKDDDARDITTDGGSAYFNSGDHDIQWGASGDLALGSGDWSVETWFYMNALPSAATGTFIDWRTFGSAPTNVPVTNITSTGYVQWYANVGSGVAMTSSVPLKVGEWTHIVFMRVGSIVTMNFNGTAVASYTDSRTFAAQVFGIGNVQTNYGIDSYYSDLRVLIGSSAYSPNFTPPTAPLTAVTNTELLASFQDAGIYDRTGINNLDTIGNAGLGFAPIYGTGSLEFDGSSDYLEIKNNLELDLSDCKWTVECWVYPTADYSTYRTIFTKRVASSPSTSYQGYLNTGTGYIGYFNGSTYVSSTALASNTWSHCAWVYDGTNINIYVNGTSVLSTAVSVSEVDTEVVIGGARGYNEWFGGYLDDFRITKGIARYTSDFTPPDEIDLSTDTHVEHVTLFLDGDGPANGQNNTFTDSSTNDFTVTESGSVVQGVFSPYGNNWSNYFSDGSAYLTASPAAPGTGEFCYECWINVPQASDDAVLETRDTNNSANGFTLTVLNSSTIRVYSNSAKITASGLSYLNQWTHLCVEKVGSTTTLYINGVSYGTTTDLANMSNTNFRIGDSQHYGAFSGYIANFRYVRGGHVYNGNFTPPTAPLTAVANTELLTCSSNRFVDESTNNHTVTVNGDTEVTRFNPFESDKPYDITTDGGSAYFGGSDAYLISSTNFTAIGTDDFTIEFWYNGGAQPARYPCIIGTLDAFGASGAWRVQTYDNNTNRFQFTSAITNYVFTTTNYNDNTWHHFAVTREGTNLRGFVDGVQQGSTQTMSDSFTSRKILMMSQLRDGGDQVGYVSDARVIKGTALYTSNFTPPTAPLTAVTNTEFLLNFQDSAIPDLSGLNNIDTVGNAKVGGTDPTKYGSNAMAFDGSGDYIKTLTNELFDFGTSDFTIEFWVYPNAYGGNISTGQVFGTVNQSRAGYAVHLGRAVDEFRMTSNASGGWADDLVVSAGGGPVDGEWTHMAVVRNGDSLEIFKNGTSVASRTGVSAYDYSGTTGVIGVFHDGSYVKYLNGYVDDLRVTKGVARYTANFTPPNAALPKF
jgi:hypothetical protein